MSTPSIELRTVTIRPDLSPVILTPWPNGGWTVNAAGRAFEAGREIGAWSSLAEMLGALPDILGNIANQPPKPRD